MTINEHILKITGSATLAGPLKQDYEYSIACICTVNKIEQQSNFNGTCKMIYKAEQSGLAVIADNYEKKQYTKGKKSLSSKLRGALWYYYSENQIPGEFDYFYKSMISGMIGNVDKIIMLLKQEKDYEYDTGG